MFSSLLTSINQYIYQILGAVIVLLLLLSIGLYARILWLNKDLAISKATISARDEMLKSRDGVIEGMAQKTAEVSSKVDAANKKALNQLTEHQDAVESLLAERFPEGCQDAVDKAIELLPRLRGKK